MKILLSRKLKQAASALLVTMVLGSILCLFVLYYLSLIQQQNTLSVRSQAWNIAIAVCEAGVEEGLQALNAARNPPLPIVLSSDDGWTFDGTYYWRDNTNAALGDNWYRIRINLADPNEPQIISRAYVTLPALAANTPNALFAAAGVTTGPGVITRAVRVTCWDRGMFLAALVAKHQIDLKGNGILTDSFDSRSLWKSYYGQYDLAYHLPGSRGDVASNDGVVGIIGVGNAEIYGKAHTGPEGTVTINEGWVGSYPKQSNGGHTDGWILQDANFTFPDTGLPYDGSSGLPLGGPADVVTVTYDYSKTMTTNSVYPNPPPWSGVTQNFVTIPLTTSVEPAPGTYVGEVTISYAGASGNEKYYTYNYILSTSYTYAVYHTNAIYTTNHYDHVLDNSDGKYYTTDDLHGSTIVLGNNASLVLPNGLNMSGNDQITIAPGASLKMYCGGTSCTVGGNGILNQAGYAEDFILECTDSVKTFNFTGNGEFIGVLVAPEANMAFNGGGHSNNDFIGSVMMNSITMNGHFSFHYDEALEALRTNPRLLVKSWDEIP